MTPRCRLEPRASFTGAILASLLFFHVIIVYRMCPKCAGAFGPVNHGTMGPPGDLAIARGERALSARCGG